MVAPPFEPPKILIWLNGDTRVDTDSGHGTSFVKRDGSAPLVAGGDAEHSATRMPRWGLVPDGIHDTGVLEAREVRAGADSCLTITPSFEVRPYHRTSARARQRGL